MKICPNCSTRYETSFPACTSCQHRPTTIDGFDAYAPQLAHSGGGFKSHYFSELAKLEGANFWFRSRNKLILWAIKKYHPNFSTLLEIGCGTAYVLSGVSKEFPLAKLVGSEIFVAGLDFAASRLPNASFMQMDARSIPFESEFDVIGAFDVLEHIKEDVTVLKQMCASLKPDGTMLLTVPQHAWLWSSIDEYACHERRYSAGEIHQKLETSGFQVVRSTSFITALLPAMMLSRFFQKKSTDKNFDASSELKIAGWLNSLFSTLLAFELVLIKTGINFPIGGSRLIVARKA